MTHQLPDQSKTLEQLDGRPWREPLMRTHLALECHRLRRVPLRAFEPSDFRILIGQNIGLEFLVPLALRIVVRDPLVEATFFAGDLLCALLRSDPRFWSAHPDLGMAMLRTAETGRLRLDRLDALDRAAAAQSVHDDISTFASARAAKPFADPSPRYHDRVVVGIPAEDTYIETPVTELGYDLVRVEDIPIFTQTVNYRDVLRVTREYDGSFELVEVFEPSRWTTFEVVLSRDDVEGPILKQFGARLTALGCRWDRVFGGVLLVSVPPELDLNPSEVLLALERPLQ